MTLIVVLLILNIPVYWLLGWIMFDSTHNAADSFWETTLAIIKAALVPSFMRAFIDSEPETDGSVFNTLFFFVSCAAVIGGEYYLLTKYVWPVE
ncbi:hypothetical protein [Blastopirellula marina]|uniref:Uncharacterized protein n=1 Tax=Blastopirellula marina DSM 3645 TaxID=314230 RepID=A3ZN60_9BACT|nr:hypothetical protein [Blastopirellula marina]EAQ81938.1 hypothetical protein DSM3645_17340 [Blastopirellula marina DSM 3645]